MKPTRTQINTEIPAPAWCRKALRLVSGLESVAGAVVGRKVEGRWKTYTVDAERLSTEEIIRECEHASGKPRDSEEPEKRTRSTAGVPLRNPDGVAVGAMFVFAADGVEIHPTVKPILTELVGIVAPLMGAPSKDSADQIDHPATLDSSFILRVFGRIQPLVSEVVGFADILQREVIGTSRKRAAIIHKNGTRVICTLKAVLDLVELESGVAAIRSAPTDLAGIARDVLDFHRAEIRKRGLRLHFSCKADRIEADVDEAVLRRILEILLSNAIKFTKTGGVTILVEQTAGEGKITVRDTGCGIRDEFVPKLFEPFSTDDEESRRNDRGIGMGLALAQRLAALIDSTIAVETRLGKGSTFTLSSPLIGPGGDTLGVRSGDVEVSVSADGKADVPNAEAD